MEVRRHHLFYLVQIIVVFIISFMISDLFDENRLLSFAMKLLFLTLSSFLLLIVLYGNLGRFINFREHSRQIEFEEMLLTTSVIVTTFMLNDILYLFRLFSGDLSFLFTIVLGIPLVFFVTYKLSFLLSASISS